MRNIQADGTAEDLIRAFVQFGCAETHVKTLIEKYNAEIENADPEDVKLILDNTDKIQNLTEELVNIAETRRSIMLRLFDMYDGNKDFWCLVKHIGIGAMNIFEAYQASDDDPELYELWLTANKRFVYAMTNFLGVEITDCAACFADILKGNDKEELKLQPSNYKEGEQHDKPV